MDVLSVLESPWFFGWLWGLFLVWLPLAAYFKSQSSFKDKKGNDTNIACAHQVVVLAPFVFLGIFGTQTWFFNQDYRSVSNQDKLWGNFPASVRIVEVMLAFQIWDLIATIVMSKEVPNQTQHLIHHASSTLLCLLGLLDGDHGWLMYYGPFFFGVSELSSIPLGFMDLFRYSDDLSKGYPKVGEIVKVAFAVLFLLIRCVYWPFVAIDFWQATLSKEADNANIVLKLVWWLANIGLTLLQYYWGYKVVNGIIKLLKGQDPTADTNEARERDLSTSLNHSHE
jgi:hypothetical protein